jgi:hypothetical protein
MRIISIICGGKNTSQTRRSENSIISSPRKFNQCLKFRIISVILDCILLGTAGDTHITCLAVLALQLLIEISRLTGIPLQNKIFLYRINQRGIIAAVRYHVAHKRQEIGKFAVALSHTAACIVVMLKVP